MPMPFYTPFVIANPSKDTGGSLLSLLTVRSDLTPRWGGPQRPHLDHTAGCTEAQLLFNLSGGLYVGTQHLSASEVYASKPAVSKGGKPYFVGAGGSFGVAPESGQSFRAALVAAPPNDSLHGDPDLRCWRCLSWR